VTSEKTFTVPWQQGGDANPIVLGNALLKDMQRAGVPVVGVLWPMGVTSGTLTSAYDETFGELLYTWRP
jgi:hypothetical protein